MDWEKLQSFAFNANATEVCTHIMGKPNWNEDNIAIREVSDGQLALRLVLSVSTAPKALYSIALTGWMTYGDKYDDDYNALSLIKQTELAEITLIQESAGQCRADLYVETSPQRWGSDRTSLWRGGQDLISRVWNDIIETWLTRTPQSNAMNDLTPLVLVQSAWKESGRPVEPARFKELVERKVIDPKTNEGAAATLSWAKEYQQVNGQQAFNITRDIETLAGDNYQTLTARASKLKKKL